MVLARSWRTLYPGQCSCSRLPGPGLGPSQATGRPGYRPPGPGTGLPRAEATAQAPPRSREHTVRPHPSPIVKCKHHRHKTRLVWVFLQPLAPARALQNVSPASVELAATLDTGSNCRTNGNLKAIFGWNKAAASSLQPPLRELCSVSGHPMQYPDIVFGNALIWL
jgi:hypothetical protein